MTYKVIISRSARASLVAIHQYLLENESLKVATKVKSTLLSVAKNLCKNPERFPIEAWIPPQKNIVRFAKQWNYKVVFEIVGTEVRVLKFFHSKRDPSKLLED